VLQLIPISDANPTKRFPVVTVALIVLNIVAFFTLEPSFGVGDDSTRYFARHVALPCQIDDCPDRVQYVQGEEPVRIPERNLLSFVGAMVFSTFLHAGFLHIAGNMLFLWVFGNNIEDFLGPVKYILFYLAAGIAASLAQIFTHLDGVASVIPAVGASGAIAGVMGAYIVLFPHARVNCLVPLFFIWTIIQLSAYIVLGIWFVLQFITGEGSGVAWMAHVGGFVFGALAILLLGGRPQRPHHLVYEPIPRF
jgi:membrane associated rhomboid family serine protease